MSIASRPIVIVAVVALLFTGCGAPAPRADPADVRALNNRAIWNRYGAPANSGQHDGHHNDASEVDALDAMIAHHRDAVVGACAWLAEHATSDASVAAIATQIVRIQTAQIDSMQSWRSEWYPDEPSTATWQPMFTDTALATDDFLVTMIAHHEHAVVMYDTWIGDGTVMHDQLGNLARRIAQGQTGEIARMEQLLRHPGGARSATTTTLVRCEP